MAAKISVHDLLMIDSYKSLIGIEAAPAWVKEMLPIARQACVVVRRANNLKNIEGDLVAVGIRGQERHQRWASFVSTAVITQVISPFALRCAMLHDKSRLDEIAAFRHLAILEQSWADIDFRWGPGGSAGYELATAVPATNINSDLDIVLEAPRPIAMQQAQSLHKLAMAISPAIDVLVETDVCAFALQEYASGAKALLLRCADGPMLAQDPWQLAVPG